MLRLGRRPAQIASLALSRREIARSEILRHADAQGRGHVLAEGRDPREAGALVEGESLALTKSGLEDEAHDPESARLGFERRENRSPDAASARVRADVHPLDLARSRLDVPDRPASHGLARARGDQEYALAVGHFVGIQAEVIGAWLWIAAGELGIERPDESARRGREEIASLNQHSVRGCLFPHLS